MWQRRLSLIIISLILIPLGLVHVSPREWQAATLWRIPPPMALHGALTGDVLVRAKPAWLGAPTNFIATVIANNQIELTWTKNVMAVNTLIRAKLGSAPTSITDGWEVYHGTASSFSDNAVSVDETWIPIYYTAWSDNVTDYSSNYISDDAGAEQVIELSSNLAWLLVILIIGLIVGLAFWSNNWFLYLVALMALIFFGLRWYGGDKPMGIEIAFASWAIAVFCLYKIIDTSRSGR